MIWSSFTFALVSVFTALAAASPLPVADAELTPTRTISPRVETLPLFTLQAFQSPSPSGVGLTGYYLGPSSSGALVLSKAAPSPAAVYYVNSNANAYLNTYPPTQLYIDTSTGALSANNTLPPSALTIPFYHLGSGKSLYTSQNGGVTEGSALFQWIGSENSYWFACPIKGGKYSVVKQMTTVNPNVGSCTAVELAAVDYST